MILIGQYDSPFVRRVAIAMRIYGIAYEHRPWSVFGNANELARYNPLRRVPTLVLDDGEVLIESGTMLDHLDERVGPDRALIAEKGVARRHALKVCALAGGLVDKAVSLVYEQILHKTPSPIWVERCKNQIRDALDGLERSHEQSATPFWFGESPGHADIVTACALRFVGEAHPSLWQKELWSRLAGHAALCEAMPIFQEISQSFSPPKRSD